MARPVSTKNVKKVKNQNTVKSGKRPWQAHPDDAIRLAAMRWFALEIERRAIELYATNATTFVALEKTMRAAIEELVRIEQRVQHLTFEEDCPGGYVRCKDGICAPMCDGYATEL